jgi:uncharacterized protein YndB with AHSA1/START domain
MVLDRIERDIEIAAPVAHVWALVTQAEHLGTWFGDAGATVDLRPGGAVTLSWREYGTGRAVIDQVDPMRVFSFRWARPRDTDPVAGNSTLVEFTLTESDSGTHLRVVETGFSVLDGDDAGRTAARDENVGGWASELEELRRYAVETPVAA